MANVTFNGATFACATAIKGSNYIHLLDADGCIIVAFEGVKSFTPFSISNGSWVTPTEDNKCPVAVMREDGTVAKGEHTCEDIGVAKKHTNDKENPHGVTKSQVGLGNVPNVATNDQTPTYTVASANTALTSGEKLSVAFGKIAKAISSLTSHLANTSNPHSVTKSQVGLGNVTNDKQMPIAGGTFTGNAKAYETARTTRGLFNEETRVSSTTGTLQSVKYFISVTDEE